jgi:hypothetical protein
LNHLKGGLTKTLKPGESFVTLSGDTITNVDSHSVRINISKKPEGTTLEREEADENRSKNS